MKTNVWNAILRATATDADVKTIAQEADIAPATVRRYLPTMIERGVIVEAGSFPSRPGNPRGYRSAS